MYKSSLIFFFILLSSSLLFAQQYNFRQYSLENGLPQSEVLTVLQDQRGNIWIGTNGGGISRFNGKTFHSLNRKNGLADNNIRFLYQDSLENLWIGTSKGVSSYNGVSFRNYSLDDGLPSLNYFQILQDSQKRIWALGADTQSTQLHYLEKGVFHNFLDSHPQINSQNQVQRIFLNKQGVLYITCTTGLYILNDQNLELSPLNQLPQFKNSLIFPLFEDQEKQLWIRTFTRRYGSRIFKMKDNDVKEIKIPSQIDPTKIGNIHLDSRQRLWLSLFGTGIALLDGDKVEILDKNRGLMSSFVNAIHEDQEGNIWLATSGDGLIKYGANKFMSLNFAPKIGGNIVRNIFQDSKNTYWFAIAGKGVVRYNNGTMKVFSSDTHPGLLNIRDFLEKPNGNILMAGFNGILEFDGRKFIDVSHKYGLSPNTAVTDLNSTPQGLWISTLGEGVVLINKDKRQYINSTENGLVTDQIINTYYDNNGNAWFCHYSGVSYYDGDTVVNYDQTKGLNDNFILQATQDNLGRYWFATYSGGINIYNLITDKWDYITSEHGLTSDNVYSILRDQKGDMWAGTQNGVDQICYDSTGMITGIRNYNKYDGFIGIENNGSANYIDRESNLWFGTINGAMMLNPTIDIVNPTPPIIHLTDIKLFFRKVNWRNEKYSKCLCGVNPWHPLPQDLRLPFDQRHLTFIFEALSYKAPEKVKYKWKLEGLDKEWSPVTSKNEAIYSNIPPGEYTFNIKASNSDGVWTPHPYQYNFEIKTPWWATWWTRSITIILAAIAIYLGVRIRLKNIQNKKKELEKQVKQKTKEIISQKTEIEKKSKVLESQKNEILHQAQNLKQSYENLKHLSDIGKVITANLSIENIIDTVYQTINSLIDATIFGIGVYQPEQNSLLFPRIKEKGANLDEIEFPLEDHSRLAVYCFLKQKEVFIADLQQEYHKFISKVIPVEKSGTPKSVIYLPLFSQQKIIGVITVQSFKKNAYKEYHLNLLRNIAVYASIALENASAYRKIEKQTRNLKRANYNIKKQKEEIIGKNDELLELNNEKNHLIGIIAHDLKNPLTSTLSIAEYLLKDMETSQRYEEMENVEYMLNTLRRMNEMVSKILDIRVIEAKKINLKMERTNLSKIVKAVNQHFKSTLKEKKLRLNLDCQNVYAHVDPNYMTQIYENLISNAIKFSPLEREIWVKVWQEGERVRTMVKDEGPGLTLEDQKKIFGKFQILSAKPTAGEKSTGLGLSIVKKYVEAMHGKVWCESEPGKGANFFVEVEKA